MRGTEQMKRKGTSGFVLPVVLGIFLIVLGLVLIPKVASAGIYLGIVDGYVFNHTGDTVEGATVTAELVGCSGSGCTGTYTTDANGYYVIGNLNYQPGQTVRVSAQIGRWQGTNQTLTIDDSTPRQVNITLCYAPLPPTLVPIADTHEFAVNASWSSDHSQPKTYDIYEFDGEQFSNVTPPQHETNLQFRTYDWRVRTCMMSCCSLWSEDEFEVYNNPPPEPVLIEQPDTNANEVNLTWNSVSYDSDGDWVYDQYQFEYGSIINKINETYHFESNLPFSSFTWRVRACDQFDLCSDWVTEHFSVSNNPPSEPTLVDVPDAHIGEAMFDWTSGIDPDGDSIYDEFRFKGDSVESPVVPLLSRANLSFGNWYWEVRTCDEFGACSEWVRDDFEVYNQPPSAPDLVSKSDTNVTNHSFEWTSGIDPDGDDTYDRIQISLNQDYSSVVYASGNDSSPVLRDNLSENTLYFWRVRTCDSFGACSGWSEDNFYIATQCVIENIQQIVRRGGGGSSRTVYQYINKSCEPDIECSEWSACLPDGYSRRTCWDNNDCFDYPEMQQDCYYNYEIEHTFGEREEGPEIEKPATFVRTRMGTWWIFTLMVFIVAVGEFLLGLFYYEKYYKRERKLLLKLKDFIISELNRGIDEKQIANRLVAVGWANQEIVYALSWAKRDMKKQEKHKSRKHLLYKKKADKKPKEKNPYSKNDSK
jgi:hypothetical protein